MRKLHVLIVDDDTAFLGPAETALTQAKYLVATVSDFDKAAAALRRFQGKAVVLSGLCVDGRSAIPFLQDTRKAYPHVPFTFVAHNPHLDEVIEALQQGAYDFLRKPVDPGILCHSVARSLEKLNLSLEGDWQENEIRKLLERNKAELKKSKALSEFKGSMISTAAHDFRSVLTVLDGYHQLIKDKCMGCGASESLELLDQARRSVNRLRTMASTLLDFEAAEKGVLKITPVRFELEPLLKDCVTFYRPYAAQKNVEVKLDGEIPPLTATGDPVRVMEVLENLLYNAVKFTPALGEIRIGAKAQGDGQSNIWITDTGFGIPKHTLKEFLGESKSVGALKDKARIGLGLSICRRLVEAQNGSIQIESTPGKGTRVLISLPV